MCEGCVESYERGVLGGCGEGCVECVRGVWRVMEGVCGGSVERGVRGCGEGYEECVRGVERGLERGVRGGCGEGCEGVWRWV